MCVCVCMYVLCVSFSATITGDIRLRSHQVDVQVKAPHASNQTLPLKQSDDKRNKEEEEEDEGVSGVLQAGGRRAPGHVEEAAAWQSEVQLCLPLCWSG